MENVIPADSPLAELLEGMCSPLLLLKHSQTNIMATGEGRAQDTTTPASPTTAIRQDQGFAPRGPSTLHSRIREKLPQPLRIHERHGSIARIHTACSVRRHHDWMCGCMLITTQKAVNSRLGRAENERFLEHFRYLIVASQLLGEQDGLRAATARTFAANGQTTPHEFTVATISPTGAAWTGSTAFVLVWLVHWSRPHGSLSTERFLCVVVVFAAVATIVYTYMRRQWLHYLRREAVQAASAVVTNLQAFETSTSSAVALIQEVELVSRGYRLYVLILANIIEHT